MTENSPTEIDPEINHKNDLVIGKFPLTFKHLGGDFTTHAYQRHDDPTWLQIVVSASKKRLLRKPDEREVGFLVLKPVDDGEDGCPMYEVMGNYNTSGRNGKASVRGIIGETIQEVVEKTGIGLRVAGLSGQGVELYNKLLLNHRGAIDVELRDGEYYVLPVDRATKT